MLQSSHILFLLLALTVFGSEGCSGNLKKTPSPAASGDKKESPKPNTNGSPPMALASTSQPAVLEVQSTLTFPDQQRVVAKLYFYSPSALKPEESKLDIRKLLATETSEPIVSLLVMGENDTEAKKADLKSSGNNMFEVQTPQVSMKTIFEPFSVQMGADSTLKDEFKIDPSVTIALPRALFLLKKDAVVRDTPSAEDLLDQVVLSKADQGSIGKIFVSKDRVRANFKARAKCNLEAVFSAQAQPTPFVLQNKKGEAFLVGAQSVISTIPSGTVGEDAFVVCRTEIPNIPGKKVFYTFKGETRTPIPHGILIQ